MAFLDNSGDIILDAVLTDTGRKRMAEGTFSISKFALGDEEIDYSLYNTSTTTALSDVEILSTPILEACTDNASGLKTKLISIERQEILYLPVIKLSEVAQQTQRAAAGAFYVPADVETADSFSGSQGGVLHSAYLKFIELHQGIDNVNISFTNKLSSTAADLYESQYIIEIDNNLGSIVSQDYNTTPRFSYLDDDDIASYIFSNTSPGSFVAELNLTNVNSDAARSPIAGARGSALRFSIKPNIELAASDNTFLTLGSEVTINSIDYYYIDCLVRVMGATTGYRVDIPVRFLKVK